MKKDKFEVGDRAWSSVYGWGKIDSIENGEEHPIIFVSDKGETESHTKDGRQHEIFLRTLFFQEIPIPESALVRPRWRAERKGLYCRVNNIGKIESDYEEGVPYDDDLFNVGNYFKSKEEAKSSRFYKVFHEEDDLNG